LITIKEINSGIYKKRTVELESIQRSLLKILIKVTEKEKEKEKEKQQNKTIIKQVSKTIAVSIKSKEFSTNQQVLFKMKTLITTNFININD
jgi:hypothetical protein